jgi:hypothetical protein
MRSEYYKARRQARETLFAFVSAWQPRLKRMGLTLDIQQSNLLGETGHVVFQHARRAAALSLTVRDDGAFAGSVSRESSPRQEAVFARVEAKTLDEFLLIARRMWGR